MSEISRNIIESRKRFIVNFKYWKYEINIIKKNVNYI